MSKYSDIVYIPKGSYVITILAQLSTFAFGIWLVIIWPSASHRKQPPRSHDLVGDTHAYGRTLRFARTRNERPGKPR